MKALIIGATGATGKDLTGCLLQDDSYTQVVLFVRRPSGTVHFKLKEIITDFENLESVAEHIKGDVLFSCLGTTLKAAGSKEKQWHIDFEIPLKFAETATLNGVVKMVLLSAYGASPKSRVFYSCLKGELEKAIEKLHFQQLIIFRPGLLLRRNTNRAAERISAAILRILNSFGLAKKFRPLPTAILAEKLALSPKIVQSEIKVVELGEIFSF